MRSVPIIALALCATSALAQTASLTEAQKRRLHVPYVRAATNCIAAAAQNDSEFANAVKTDYFQPLIARGWEACKQQLTAMVQAHDQIYGGGGLEFAKGA